MRTALLAAMWIISLDYLLLGFFFLGRIREGLRLRGTQPAALLATVAAVLFFFGCVHTHQDIVYLPPQDEHWYSWWNVTSHWLQALGGFTFWYVARKHLVIKIYDKVKYEEVTRYPSDKEISMDITAARLGLIR